VLIAVAVLALGVVAVATLRVGGEPMIEITPDLPAIGPATPVAVTVAEPRRGLARVVVEVIQGDLAQTLEEKTYTPRGALSFWGEAAERDETPVTVGATTVGGLGSGEATIRVTAARAGTWLWQPAPAVREITLPVRLEPPSLEVLSDHHYIAQGGSEAVVYRVGPTAVRDGVAAGDWWFPGFPLPGGAPGERFALLAAPYDLADAARIQLVATDDVGNEARTAFIDRLAPHPVEHGTIELSEDFMARVVPEILSHAPELADQGSLLANYVEINSELRRRNRQRLRELARRSQPAFLWHRPFLQMPNAQVMSPFAVERAYRFEGRQVDRQLHLGFDLASVRRDAVPAANSGTVLHAGYLGIYGNAVILDHGYGLMSLYGHLSSLAVAEGDSVERGQTLGRTGATGLAGGDHLHFAVLLEGLPVNPVEWWDGRWIAHRIAAKLGPAMGFEG
jgi:hypothetical protein